MINAAPRIAGIELGGTKGIALIAEGNRILDRRIYPTRDPETTLEALTSALLEWHAERPVDAVGIASFGPVDLDPGSPRFGHILTTPKPGWSGADILGSVQRVLTCPVAIDTDVNGAALAEYRWGAGQGCDGLCYLTIGTGIGGGLIINGAPVHGLLHPEIGHIRVRRAPGDNFPGICPFHGDCVEGLTSGPALIARFGTAANKVAPNDRRWIPVAKELAELTAMLLLTVSPRRILIGGGVGMGQSHLFPMIRAHCAELLAGYLPDLNASALEDIIKQPSLGTDAGPMGAVALGLLANATPLGR